jgi:hypothetical protein
MGGIMSSIVENNSMTLKAAIEEYRLQKIKEGTLVAAEKN